MTPLAIDLFCGLGGWTDSTLRWTDDPPQDPPDDPPQDPPQRWIMIPLRLG